MSGERRRDFCEATSRGVSRIGRDLGVVRVQLLRLSLGSRWWYESSGAAVRRAGEDSAGGSILSSSRSALNTRRQAISYESAAILIVALQAQICVTLTARLYRSRASLETALCLQVLSKETSVEERLEHAYSRLSCLQSAECVCIYSIGEREKNQRRAPREGPPPRPRSARAASLRRAAKDRAKLPGDVQL